MGPVDYADALLQYGQQAATANPLMLAKALRQQQAYPRENIQQAMNYPQDWSQFGQNLSQAYPTSSPEAVRQAAYQAAVNAGPLMTVWQGSPHRFAPTKNNPLGEFDATKIGSGEGAQAYGYGHYLAENPGVARSYMDAGGNGKFLTVSKGGKDIYGDALTPQHLEAIKLLELGAKDAGQFKHNAAYYAKKRTQDAEVLKLIEEFKDANIGYKSHASLYKVDLPDDQIAKMLDWDKPLSQQPEHVRTMLKNIFTGNFAKSDPTGAEIYKALTQDARDIAIIKKNSQATTLNASQAKASQDLRDFGIPGIRYLDGGSRAGGQGTSNFVVFPGNEGILKILSRE